MKETRDSGFEKQRALLMQLSAQLYSETKNAERSDVADSDVIEREMQATVQGMADSRLPQILDALERLRNGTYGICMECGDSIPRERLDVLPETTHCVSCQERRERQLKLIMDLRDSYFPNGMA